MRSWGGVPREIFITYSKLLPLTGLWKSVLDISKRALRRFDRSIEAANRSEWLALVLSGESGWSLWINSVRSTFKWKHRNQQLIIIHTRLVISTMVNSHKEDCDRISPSNQLKSFIRGITEEETLYFPLPSEAKLL